MQQQQTERWTQQMQQMYERVAEWLKGFWQTLCTLWQDPHKRVRLMVAAGFAGMGLILCSRLCQPPKDEGRPMAAAQTTETAPEASLEQQLAENLGRMLGQLEGAGECQVMVTLRQSPRTVYASEQNSRARSSGEIYPIDQEQQNKPVLVRDAQGVDPPAGGSNAGSAGQRGAGGLPGRKQCAGLPADYRGGDNGAGNQKHAGLRVCRQPMKP